MERFSRRSVAGAGDAGDSSDSASASASGRARRRRGSPEARAAASDDAETDSSSVATPQSQSQLLPRQRQRRRSSARKAAEETRKAREREGRGGLRSGHEEDEEGEEDDDEPALSGSEGKRAHQQPQRERSLSNVSTTSSTSASSLASEPLSEEARAARLAQQLEELEQKKRMVEDGTLAEYCRRVTEFKEERNRLLQTAELHKNLQLKNGQDLYGFEVQRAHHLWRHGKAELQHELLTRLDGVQAVLLEDLAALDEPKAASVSSAARGRNGDSVEADAEPEHVRVVELSSKPTMEPKTSPEDTGVELWPAAKRQKTEVLPEQAVRLPLDAITADLAAIAGERKQVAQATHAKLAASGVVAATTGLTLRRRRLEVGKCVFEDGDDVTLLSPLVREQYTGSISSITADAVYLKLVSGQKVRVWLPLLERRRCELKPLLRGSSATGTLQTSGWTDCEPF